MTPKLLIVVFSWLATMGGLFLFSFSLTPQINQQTNILQTTPTAPPIEVAPQKNIPTTSTTSLQTSTTTTALPPTTSTTVPPTYPSSDSISTTTLPTKATTTMIITTTTAPVQTQTTTTTSAPTQQVQHIFYTSSHWKAKYYYCDTDNDWKDLSPTYLKSFNSEAELLRNYSRTLQEPCK